MNALAILNTEFLDMRSKMIELASSFDRIERAVESDLIGLDARLSQLREAARILHDDRPNRAEQILMLFSDSYDPKWKAEAVS